MNDLMEIEKILLNSEKPSKELSELFLKEETYQRYPFDMLYRLKEVPQSKVHHPEGDVWIHTLMVVDQAAKLRDKSNNRRRFMWAALMHDVGKFETTRVRKGKITAYDHDKASAKKTKEFFEFFNEDEKFIKDVVALVRWHMQPLFVVKNLPFADIDSMIKEVDIEELSLLCYADRTGRGTLEEERIEAEKENMRIFREKVLGRKRELTANQ
ncbi:HD domain-containing protein [Oceanirhabdus sp. W0125-5]|uniref:HD domain-containing protein n=1 Tax=Oceanirhabdus sp. W0125-5 TaxID=2999116 RepID=UPI0022F2E89D|nr:HD domain-containing protein [Oceanirhabdus sp. W0125-5]WBW99551.1 HD domain-containing protein [Oceanirhabdus sp. W0125-5]